MQKMIFVAWYIHRLHSKIKSCDDDDDDDDNDNDNSNSKRRHMHFLPQVSFGPQVLSLPASVWVCVSMCVRICQPQACPHHNSSPLQARITKLGSEMQNTLIKLPVVLWANDLDLQDEILLKTPNLSHFELVRTITHYLLKLGSPNLDQRYKTPWLKSLSCFWACILHLYLFRQLRVYQHLMLLLFADWNGCSTVCYNVVHRGFANGHWGHPWAWLHWLVWNTMLFSAPKIAITSSAQDCYC